MPQRFKDIKMTMPEWYVYWALIRLGKTPNVDFVYRQEVAFTSSLATAAQLDFQITDGSQIAFEVQGLFWHYRKGNEKLTEDFVRNLALASSGWTVIAIDEDDIMADPSGQAVLRLVTDGLKGISHARRAGDFFISPIAF